MNNRALGLPGAFQAVVSLPESAVGAIGRGLGGGSETEELGDTWDSGLCVVDLRAQLVSRNFPNWDKGRRKKPRALVHLVLRARASARTPMWAVGRRKWIKRESLEES